MRRMGVKQGETSDATLFMCVWHNKIICKPCTAISDTQGCRFTKMIGSSQSRAQRVLRQVPKPTNSIFSPRISAASFWKREKIKNKLNVKFFYLHPGGQAPWAPTWVCPLVELIIFTNTYHLHCSEGIGSGFGDSDQGLVYEKLTRGAEV